ncbi:MAG: SpvB/TcaC N-terminal domain-containing protein, partial [Lysobacteraceae bacterium]
MNKEQGDVRGMSDTVRMRLAAGLLLLVVSVLLLPIGVVLRDSLAGSPAANGFSIAPDTVSDSVSVTPAQFRVAESGAATYAIPLFTVPGTAGVTPQLSLSYSSQGGDGPVGMGWSIGGLSAVSRCRATRESGDFIVGGVVTDGNPAPVNFSATDRYCLDGQRLLSADDGAACPAVSGMTVENLRTELQSFQRVCAYTPAGGTAGVAFFTVERKDGSTSWYGDRDNSLTANRADGYVNSTVSGKEAFALSWAQTRFQDSTGNYIDYLYSEGTAPENPGEHLISKVRYTGKTVLAGQASSAKAPYAEVVFNYNGSFFDNRAYVAGGLIRSRSQLQSVTSSVDHDDDGSFTPVRHYALTYLRGRAAQVLTSLQECRDATQQVCAAPTPFEWSAARANEADTNLFQTWEATASIPNGSLSKFEGMKFGDIDGDGRQDMVWLKDGSSGDACVSKQVNLLYSRLDGNGSPTLLNA